jgi:peptide/nickel transport system substrate-binding protein/oligopeptide transport system substrate-binding protein
MRALPLFLAGLLPVALLVAACDGSRPGGDLAVVVAGDPGAAAAMADTLAAEASRGTLITRAAGGELAPGLATSWRFLDQGEDLILRLAPVRWPGSGDRPGAELEARDVVASLRRIPLGARAARAAAGLEARGTARAPIARVVELTPRPATPYLLDWLADPALAVISRRGQPFPGPYDLIRQDGGLRLARRSETPRPDAQAASILIETAAPEDAIKRFAGKQPPLVLGAGLAGLSDARAAGLGRALQVEPVHGVIGLSINGVKGGALADSRLRRALLLVADGAPLANRFALAALVAQARLWDGLPPPADERALPLPERQARAAVLLKEAGGWGPERPLPLTLMVPAGPEAALLADELAGSLAPLGIALKIVRTPRDAAAKPPAHDLALVEIVARVPDPVAHLERWRCGRVQPCSDDADARLNAARAAGGDPAARAAAAEQAESALMVDPAFIPLLRPVRWSLVGPGISGFQPNPLGWHPLGRISRSR